MANKTNNINKHKQRCLWVLLFVCWCVCGCVLLTCCCCCCCVYVMWWCGDCVCWWCCCRCGLLCVVVVDVLLVWFVLLVVVVMVCCVCWVGWLVCVLYWVCVLSALVFDLLCGYWCSASTLWLLCLCVCWLLLCVVVCSCCSVLVRWLHMPCHSIEWDSVILVWRCIISVSAWINASQRRPPSNYIMSTHNRAHACHNWWTNTRNNTIYIYS